MPKEDRSHWVAVGSESGDFGGGLGTKIKPATSAYQYFQKDVAEDIRADLAAGGDPTFSVSKFARAVSDRWAALDGDEKARYEDMAREDSYRFYRESHAADIAAIQRREKLQKERETLILDDEDGGRGGRRKTRGQYRDKQEKLQKRQRKKMKKAKKKQHFDSDDDDDDDDDSSASYREDRDDDDDDDDGDGSSGSYDSNKTDDSDDDDSGDDSDDSSRPRKKKKKKSSSYKKPSPPPPTKPKRVVTEKQLQHREKLRQEKIEKETYIEQRQDEIRKERASQAKKRMLFLLKQSSIFSHFGAVQEDRAKLGATSSGGAANNAAAASSSSVADEQQQPQQQQQSHNSRHSLNEQAKDRMDAEDLENGNERQATFLTSQPSTLGHGQMRPYQLEGLNWMIRLQENGVNGILADEMGLGKTLQSISVLVFMNEYSDCNGPHLIVVPKSTLSNWMMELSKWAPTLTAVKFHGDKETREHLGRNVLRPGQRDEEREWNVVVTTYEVCNIEKNILNKFAWSYLIIDEAHRLKNDASAFSQNIRSFETRYRILLTGTPLQNSLHELWALLNFLVPDVFASAEQFDEWFNLDIEDNDKKNKLISQLHKILRPFMLRRLKADVETSLPPKHETILFTGMSVMQKKLYRDILLRDIDAITGDRGGSGGGQSRTAILNIVMQLRKCAGHPYLFPGVEDRSLPPLGEHLVENCGKMVLLDKLLKRLHENGHRVLLFTQMTRILDILEDYLVMRRYKYCRIDGNTSYEDREDFIDSYNAPQSEKFLFLLSTRAGGLGINLQTADVVILYDSDWNPQADLQAQDRAHRIGQKRPVQVFRFVTEHTIEEKIVERAQQKLKLDAMVVQQGRLKTSSADNKLSRDDLLEAVRFGADKIFKSKDSSITDDDIDIILNAGKRKTEELNEKLQSAEKGDLLDFKLESGGKNDLQTFEGVDYSSNALAAAKAEAELLGILDVGKRERKTVANYNENLLYQQQIAALQGKSVKERKKKKEVKIPKQLRLPRMDDWQMYDRSTLQELQEEEVKAFRNLPEEQQKLASIQFAKAITTTTTTTAPTTESSPASPNAPTTENDNNATTATATPAPDETSPQERGQESEDPGNNNNSSGSNDNNQDNNTGGSNGTTSPPTEQQQQQQQQELQQQQEEIPPLLSEEKQAQKERLLAEGFADWRKPNYIAFARASARYGRHNIPKIAIGVGKSETDVDNYARAFWDESVGKKRFPQQEYDRVVKMIEKGEKKIDEMKGLERGTRILVSLFENPWEELEFTHVNTKDKFFTAEEDRYLLCWTHKYGYGQWFAIKMAVRRCPAFRFDYFLRSLPVDFIGRRCEQLMKAAEKEVEHIERKARDEAGISIADSKDGSMCSGEDFRLMQRQIRMAKKNKFETQRQQLEAKVKEIEIEMQKIHDRLKDINEFGRHGNNNVHREIRNHDEDNINDNNNGRHQQQDSHADSAVAGETAVAAGGGDDHHHGGGEGESDGKTGGAAPEDINGAIGADGDFVKFDAYDGKEPPKEWKKAFTQFCNGTRREVKDFLGPVDRKNKQKVNEILKDRWLALENDKKKYWRKWAAWDKIRHERDMAIFKKNNTNQVDEAAAAEDGGGENEMHIPKKRKGAPDANNNNSSSVGYSSIPKKKNRH